MLRVFIALGKQLPKDKAMLEDTQEVARLLAKYNCTMVQGGAKIGLMGMAVQEFQKYSNEVVMIVPEAYKSDLIGTKSKEYYIVEGESDRMRITINTCDMMIVLPGGSGTLAELSYYTETRKSGEHQASIIVVNTHGYYNQLFKFQKQQIKKGFMKEGDCKFTVIKTAKDLEPILKELITKKQAKLQQKEVEKQAKKEAADEAKKAPAQKAESKKTAPVKAAKAAAAKKAEPKKPIVKEEPKKVAKATTKVKTKKVEIKKADVKVETKTAPKKEVAKPVVKAEPKKVEVKEVKKPATKAPVKAPAKKAEVKPAVKAVKAPAKKAESKPVQQSAAKTAAVKKPTVKAATKAAPKKETAKKPATKAPAKKPVAKAASKSKK